METFRLKKQTFLSGYTFHLHENSANAREMYENVFTSKILSNVETFKITTKKTLCKRHVSNENVNAEM